MTDKELKEIYKDLETRIKLECGIRVITSDFGPDNSSSTLDTPT